MLICVACGAALLNIELDSKKEAVIMLNENLKRIRKSKGLSQEELAVKLNVVRQTVSKWERGLSVPDSEMLISISEVLETPVSVLLGDTVENSESNDLKSIAEKLEVINLQLANQKRTRRIILHWMFIVMGVLIVLIFVMICVAGSPYLNWDYSDPETAVVGVAMHAFEFLFVRIAPLAFIVAIVGAAVTRNRD